MDVDNNIAQLERIIGHSFNNKLLCAEALRMGPPTALLLVEGKVHSVKNNGRMETYGDRLLEQVLCELWYNSRYPSGDGLTRGDWTTIRETMLTNDHLTRVGFRMGIDRCIIFNPLSRRVSNLMVAKTVEAVAAAVYEDTWEDWGTMYRLVQRLGLDDHPLLKYTTLRVPRKWSNAPEQDDTSRRPWLWAYGLAPKPAFSSRSGTTNAKEPSQGLSSGASSLLDSANLPLTDMMMVVITHNYLLQLLSIFSLTLLKSSRATVLPLGRNYNTLSASGCLTDNAYTASIEQQQNANDCVDEAAREEPYVSDTLSRPQTPRSPCEPSAIDKDRGQQSEQINTSRKREGSPLYRYRAKEPKAPSWMRF